MRLPFDPCYSDSPMGEGTDIRNGNGELKGSTHKVKGGYSAWLSDGLRTTRRLGTYPSDLAAQMAILKSYAY